MKGERHRPFTRWVLHPYRRAAVAGMTLPCLGKAWRRSEIRPPGTSPPRFFAGDRCLETFLPAVGSYSSSADCLTVDSSTRAEQLRALRRFRHHSPAVRSRLHRAILVTLPASREAFVESK